MLGRLLAEWGEAPAGCLFLLPLWHPVLVAEQIGTLAAIARGRFIMQCGLGWGDARFAAMGANIRTRPSAFEEALDIVRRLLAGETVSSSGASESPKRASHCARPRRSKSGSAPAHRLLSTAQHAWRKAGSRVRALPPKRRACRPTCIVSAASFTARSPAPSSCGVTSTSASRRPTRRRIQLALSQSYRGMAAEALVAGSVDDVTEQFRIFGEIGYTDILVRHLTDDQPKILGSLQRLAAVRAALV